MSDEDSDQLWKEIDLVIIKSCVCGHDFLMHILRIDFCSDCKKSCTFEESFESVVESERWKQEFLEKNDKR
jgi:hypothetical protein